MRACVRGGVRSVRPPKKSWKNISNLSGGEKTLSSLSLVFALHHYKVRPPAPPRQDAYNTATATIQPTVLAGWDGWVCIG